MSATDHTLALELHPLCTLFPRLAGAEFEALKADIVANGQHEPITVYEGLVLDGGNRYRACIEAGIEPKTKPFTGADPVSFVLSANLHRRHLMPGQHAIIVSRAQDWASAQAVGRPGKSGNVAALNTVADRAARSGASERTQRMADKVARQSPELAKQVAHGEITLPRALEQLAPKPAAAAQRAPAAGADAPEEGPDDLYDQAAAIVLQHRRASISLVQRHLRIGYNRAARLIEQMERAGIVTPPAASGERIVVAAVVPASMALAGTARPTLVQQVQQQASTATEAGAEESVLDAHPVDELDAASDDDHFEQLIEENRRLEQMNAELQREVERMRQHVDLLTRDDLADQVDGLVKRADAAELKFDQLSGRNRQLQQTARDAQITAQYQADLLAKIRKALAAEGNADILPAIMARRAAA